MARQIATFPEGYYLEICRDKQHIDDQYYDLLSEGLPVVLKHMLIVPYLPADHIRREYWFLYRRLIHQMIKLGQV